MQRNAMKSRDERIEFKKLLLDDADVMRVLNPDDIEQLLDLTFHLRHVDTIFERVFGSPVA